MRLFHIRGLVLFLAILATGIANAQVPDKFTNLKVLPQDISKAQLVETMKGFALGLGVRCSACHMGEEGKPLSTYDFASDEKRTKQNARVMLQMVHDINTNKISQIKLDQPPVTVTCFTCHRGQKQPASAAPMPAPPAAAAPKPTS
jgi:hypothetical protein